MKMKGAERMERETIAGERVTENIYLCPDGKYRWIYEFPMLKNPGILISVFKVLGLSALAVGAFVLMISLIGEGGVKLSASGDWKTGILVILFLIFLVLLSYLILAAGYGWKYIVLFEMDEEKVVHIHMPKQFKKAEALGWLTAAAGLAAGSYTAAGAGVLAATRSSSTSIFENVRKVCGRRSMHTIKVNQLLDRNQVYADEVDYDFVWKYITERCVNARIR